jgi:ABC-type nitrate/sulfonate/bicarbonate transport system ATPase subunit
MPMTPRLEIRQVSKAFRAGGLMVSALEDISLQVMPKEFLTIVGPSGSGKSTLFNLIAGLLEPDEGQILIDGRPASTRLGQFGYMPQRDLLLPWRSVIENVILPQEVRGEALPAARRRAAELLPLFGLEGFADAFPAELSGGMRQRAALLRTVLSGRDILLLDEPFGALDALTRRELQDWLLGLWQNFRQTVIFITHDVEEAIYLGDRVVVISPRPGRVLSTLQVSLPRPRRQGMIARPEFGRLAAELLQSLGVHV